MISWKFISVVRTLATVVVIAAWLAGYPLGMTYGLLGLMVTYMWSVDKMEGIVKKLDPENKTEEKDNADGPEQD
jgi:hypothetical protein